MKRLNLILPILLLLMIFNTSCSKEEETPAPTPIVTSTPTPTVVVKSFSYVRGSGLTDLNLKVTDASSNVLFFNNITGTLPATSQFSINEDQTYTYIVTANSSSLTETGTFGYSSTSGMWNTSATAPTVIDFHLQGITVTIWKP